LQSIVVIQARTSSTRLPAKVLMPVCGFPLVVLAAKRAGNTGRKVIVATSDQISDDYLASVVTSFGIPCFRGSLGNTLSRYVMALSAYEDEMIVFRLTADNVLPDGSLLDEIEQDYVQRGLRYLCCNGESSGLPYGMSVEVMRLAHLRYALDEELDAFDKEHVTSAIVRRFGSTYFTKYLEKGMGHFRCTIDSLDDYLSVTKLFEGVDDPIKESWDDLIWRLKGLQLQPVTDKPINRLVLGAAQLGMPYGIANKYGQPCAEIAETLIKNAIVNGVVWIDTARAYGDSESMLSRVLADGWEGRAKVITKLSPLANCPVGADKVTVDAFVDGSVYRSLYELGLGCIDVLLLHRAAHLYEYQGQIWNRLREHAMGGRITALGVSVQTPEELMYVLAFKNVEHIQLPFNILDWRWDPAISKVIEAKSKRKLTVHLRSIYLQGLLTTRDKLLWSKAGVIEPEKILASLDDLCLQLGRISIQDLCIAYANGLKWVDGLVIGMETMQQLQNNLELMQREPLMQNEIEMVCNLRPYVDEIALNPTMWSKD